MGGIVGRFFSSFGLTVAFAIVMSLFVSFTLTPMLCSRFLKLEPTSRGTRESRADMSAARAPFTGLDYTDSPAMPAPFTGLDHTDSPAMPAPFTGLNREAVVGPAFTPGDQDPHTALSPVHGASRC